MLCHALVSLLLAWTPGGRHQARDWSGRYALGYKVVKVQRVGDTYQAMPLWWGGYQLLSMQSENEFALMARTSTHLSFAESNRDRLTISGQAELDGVYTKLDERPAPLEELRSGKAKNALLDLTRLGIKEAELDALAEHVLTFQPSRRRAAYELIKLLVKEHPTAARRALLGDAAVMIGKRTEARKQYEEALRLDATNQSAQTGLRMVSPAPVPNLPFSLGDIYSAPTRKELDEVRRVWSGRDLRPSNVTDEKDATLTIDGVKLRSSLLSCQVGGNKLHGVVLAPMLATAERLPVIVELKGVSVSFFPLVVPEGILSPAMLGKDLSKYIVVLPGVRGERVVFDGQEYQNGGDASDSWDGATDDAIAFLTAALQKTPEADPGRVAAFGKSRGGTVAMLMGIRDKRIKGVLSWSGPAGWIENMPQLGWSQQEQVAEGLRSKSSPSGFGFQSIRTFLQPALDGKAKQAEVRRLLISSSPVYFASDLPPTQVHYGENDFIVEPINGKAIKAKAGKAEISLIVEADGGHDLNLAISIPTSRSFLERVLHT